MDFRYFSVALLWEQTSDHAAGGEGGGGASGGKEGHIHALPGAEVDGEAEEGGGGQDQQELGSGHAQPASEVCATILVTNSSGHINTILLHSLPPKCYHSNLQGSVFSASF